MTDLRYPIGRFSAEDDLSDEQRRDIVEKIATVPAKLRAAVWGLSSEQLDTPYRPEGWTARQVVHHLADSHANAYIRFRLALTEQEPAIKPYDEKGWALLADARSAPVEFSLVMLESLHQRWVWLLRSLTLADLDRSLRHPKMGVMNLKTLIRLYEWHGRHHIAHITALRERMGWG